MSMKVEHVKRAIALNGSEVVAIMAIIKSMKGMPTDHAQSFLSGVWLDWRRESEDIKPVHNGIGCFFDLYFSLHGDFDRIYSVLASSVPEQYRAQAEAEAQELADQNIEQARKYGPPCQQMEVVGVALPAQRGELPN